MNAKLTSRKRTTRILSLLLLSALLFTSVPVTAQAASKPKKIVWVNSAKKRTTYAKEKVQMQTKVSPSSAKQAVTYSSSNKSVATVSKSGKVTFKKKGTVTITAKTKAKPVKKVTCKFTVKYEKLKFTNTVPTLIAGATFANPVKNPNKKTILYSSSNPAVCNVDSKGTLTATGMGSATITAKAKDGKMTASKYTVEVLPKLEISKVKFVGHRGLYSMAPENSRASFELAAAEQNFWGIETDVRPTLDGDFVLVHDASIGGKTVSATSTSEMLKVPIQRGGRLDYYTGSNTQTVIELRDYLTICKNANKVPVIEIKWTENYALSSVNFYDDSVLKETVTGVGGLYITTKRIPTITKTGFTFDGWYTEKNGSGTKLQPGIDKFPMDGASVSYYANWIQDVADDSSSDSNLSDVETSEIINSASEDADMGTAEEEQESLTDSAENESSAPTETIEDLPEEIEAETVISPAEIESEIAPAEYNNEVVELVDDSANFLSPSEVTVDEEDDPAILRADENDLVIDEDGELSLIQTMDSTTCNYVQKLYDEVKQEMNDATNKNVVFISFTANALSVMREVIDSDPNTNGLNTSVQYLLSSGTNPNGKTITTLDGDNLTPIEFCDNNNFGLDAAYTNSYLTKDAITSIKAKNIEVNLWTVNEYMDIYNCIQKGTDYITTNYKWW